MLTEEKFKAAFVLAQQWLRTRLSQWISPLFVVDDYVECYPIKKKHLSLSPFPSSTLSTSLSTEMIIMIFPQGPLGVNATHSFQTQNVSTIYLNIWF